MNTLPDTKICKRCHKEKPLFHFGQNKDAADKLKYICRECDAAIHRARYRGEAEILKERSRKNRERARREGLCLSCFKPLGDSKGKNCNVCAETANVAQKMRRRRDMEACLAAYGGKRCACCGETQPTFLTLDHINGDGNKHRKLITKAKNAVPCAAHFYAALRRAGFPPGLQVLCWNCNLGRERNGGICPHEEQRRAQAS